MSALSNVKTILSKVVTSFVSENGKIASYYIKASKKKIQKNTILYEVRDGQSIVDSPYAMFMHLVKDPEYAHFHHIWVINDLNYPTVKRIKAEFDNVEFVERNSKRYLLWLATAEYLINNATFQSFFLKREGQTYINTWHGTPLKYMGFDIPGNPAHSQNVVRNFLMADYILSPNSHTTEIFSKSYRLDGLFPGTILEGGYPRIDRTNTINRESIKKELKKLNLTYNDRLPTILYTPTWKGSSILNPSNDKEQIVKETIFLKEHFKDQYNVLVKVHPYIYRELSRDEEIRSILIPDYLDPNEVLSIVDLLITDYSSIFFDFLVTDKPIIFYVWDRDLYEVDRGMYLKESDLPGPAAETIDDLIALIEGKNHFVEQYKHQYEELKNHICFYQDGNSTKRYIERIFKKKTSKQMKEVLLLNNKKKLVVYPGGMKNNGITTSFINLSNTIDYQKYDVSIILNKPSNNEEIKNLEKINSQVRMLFRPGKVLYSNNELLRDIIIQIFTANKPWGVIFPRNAYIREAARSTANIKFDDAIDFSGYSFFWAKMIAFVNSKKKIIFQHNDLLADSQKVINGKAPHKKNLPAVFSIYSLFDRVLSVSKETMEINKRNLKKYVREEQVGYTTNTIDVSRILGTGSHGSKKDEIFHQSINDFRYNGSVASGSYKMAKNLHNLNKNSFFYREINEKDNIYVLAETIFNNCEYAKITLNGIYTGWIKKKYINPVRLSKQDETGAELKVSLIATVNCEKDEMIYHSIENFQDIRSPLKYLNNSYVYVSKQKKVNGQLYCYIENNQGNLGWINIGSLSNFHRAFGLKFIRNYFLNKNKPEKIVILNNFQSIRSQGIILDDITKGWSEPAPIYGSEEISVSLNSKDQLLLLKKASFGHHDYYWINDFNGGVWIDAKNIEERRLNDEDLKENFHTREYKNNVLPTFEISSDFINLVNMGRLSPEKNQLNLIKAIKILIDRIPNIRLYILGEGPLKLEMNNLITQLGLNQNVILLGHQDDPFGIMKQCDLFVFPSLYEGQPMVLLEALTLNLPVLASDIPANISVLKNYTSQFIIGFDSDNIAKAIMEVLNSDEDVKIFDPIDYNKNAIQKFYKELE
ncbi:CDP-glycerol glycerophosphotransferase family protein [Enterococcus casseliflavus]|uniref:CDP-glycerol glycerophosphotransferase family protein n=1 Tax=Enterococcus casseliflavus TaxID=37734 RepID=UPI002952C4AC|nr:CDP-glycerol glycerophosphotransferase family protein [Enterococcus casseliflavus]MDV7737543.1 CDP-glycerol glycerophosphotransferase family protein [Enterococcus casseliflavus]